MSLEEFMAHELGDVPHRHRSESFWRDVKEGVPGASGALLAISLLADAGRWRGEERIEDFELKLNGPVLNTELRRLVLAHYEPQGWRIMADGLNLDTTFEMDRQTEHGREELLVCMTNQSRNPTMAGTFGLPEVYPKLQVTCALIKRPKSRED